MILNKCVGYCEVFVDFDVDVVVCFMFMCIEKLLENLGIVCNCVKVELVVINVCVV